MAETAIQLRDVSIPELVKKLDADGVVCVENVISTEWLDAVRAAVPEYVAVHGERDFLVADVGDEDNTPEHELVAAPELKALFTEIAAASWPRVGRMQMTPPAET